MATKFRTERVPIEDVHNGMRLAVLMDKTQARVFQVESTGIEHTQGDPTLFVIKSGPLADAGGQIVIKQPAGTLLDRVVEVYDDGASE